MRLYYTFEYFSVIIAEVFTLVIYFFSICCYLARLSPGSLERLELTFTGQRRRKLHRTKIWAPRNVSVVHHEINNPTEYALSWNIRLFFRIISVLRYTWIQHALIIEISLKINHRKFIQIAHGLMRKGGILLSFLYHCSSFDVQVPVIRHMFSYPHMSYRVTCSKG